MRRVYLASKSRARKKLFALFGLKFKVMHSSVKEKRRKGNLSCAELVKENALSKARSVSKKVKSGIIVAADTITVQGKKIFGKPANLSSAKRMLKTLSSKPQLLYTGIAVIDKDKNKTLVDYEKTKVYMDKLSAREIKSYFAKVSPLDKAGSFDIQGKGAFFIRRIEGCFYNVVGLPLRKLYRIFKKFNLKILFIALSAIRYTLYAVPAVALCVFLAGCSTEYNIVTGQQETYFYSTDREVEIGKSVDKELLKKEKLVDDPLIQHRVEEVGQKIAAVCDRKEIDYHFKVLDDEEVNAVSLPGGFVYVNKGLVERVANDDELAAVLAHEVAHIVARHSIKKLQAMMGYSFLRVLIAQAPGGGEVGNAADLAFATLISGYAREDELLADRLGSRYVKRAGYNPRAMIDFLTKLQQIERKKPLRAKSYFKTHPYVPDRIRVVKEELGEKIGYSDYINIEQKPHE